MSTTSSHALCEDIFFTLFDDVAVKTFLVCTIHLKGFDCELVEHSVLMFSLIFIFDLKKNCCCSCHDWFKLFVPYNYTELIITVVSALLKIWAFTGFLMWISESAVREGRIYFSFKWDWCSEWNWGKLTSCKFWTTKSLTWVRLHRNLCSFLIHRDFEH